MNLLSLSCAQRCLYLGRERESYRVLYPDIKPGVKGKGRAKRNTHPDTFDVFAAAKYGVGKRLIIGCVALYSTLGEEVLKAAIGTSVDKEARLERLKVLSHEDRLAYIRNTNGKRVRLSEAV